MQPIRSWLRANQVILPKLLRYLAWLVLPLTLPAVAEPAALPSLHREGHWLVDEHQRVVTLHGLNGAWKSPPYVAPDSALGFGAADADFLAANGFNAFRLGITFAGVMPAQGQIDQNYLKQVDRIVQLLTERQIWVFLDMHQDQYSEKFAGAGFPDWAIYDDGIWNPFNLPFPVNYFTSSALQHAFDNFWNNHNNLWDHYSAALQAVAAQWRDQPYLLGYEIINEPSPGSATLSCLPLFGCPDFDQKLQAFEEYALAAIRQIDPVHMVLFEPQNVTATFASPTWYKPTNDSNLIYSWHTYCTATVLPAWLPPLPDCAVLKSAAMSNAMAQADTLGAVPLLTEFAADDNAVDLAQTLDLLKDHFIGWTYWQYKNWDAPVGSNSLSQGASLFTNDRDLSTLKQDKADVLIRPYARAVAGIPDDSEFNGLNGEYTLRYQARAATAPTEIFIPARHYPRGYSVTVSGGQVISTPGAALLEISNSAETGAVQVVVKPLR